MPHLPPTMAALQPCSLQPRSCSQLQSQHANHLAAFRPRCNRALRNSRPRTAAVASHAAFTAVGDLAEMGVSLASGSAIGAGVILAGLAGLRFTAYSQLEYVTAAVLARHVKAGGARVLQLGGSTRDLYYYPKGTIQVTVVAPDLNKGLWEQAGVQAQVPVVARAQPLADSLLFQPDASVDSVVLLNTLSAVRDVDRFCSEVYRVLKPGGTFVFVQRVRGGALQPLILGAGPAVAASTVDLVTEFSRWDYVQVDPALQQTDLHAVGVAIKPLRQQTAAKDDQFSVDKSAFEQLMKSSSRAKGGGGSGGSSQGFGKK